MVLCVLGAEVSAAFTLETLAVNSGATYVSKEEGRRREREGGGGRGEKEVGEMREGRGEG